MRPTASQLQDFDSLVAKQLRIVAQGRSTSWIDHCDGQLSAKRIPNTELFNKLGGEAPT